MVILSAVMVLAASPVHVVAVHASDRETGLVLKALSGKGTTIDATPLHAYLLRPKVIIPMQDFDGFTAGPAQGWPRAASDVWKKAVAHCLTVVGPPPWSRTSVPTAVSCANRLSEFLWQRYAAEVKAARVFVIDVAVDEKNNLSSVTGLVWEPSVENQLALEERGAAGDAKALIDKVTKALLGKQGLLTPRLVISEFGSGPAGSPDPFHREPKVTTAITLKKSCAALPVKLTVTPAGPVGESFAARWAPADATGPELACALTFSEHEEPSPFGPLPAMTVVTVTASCGKTSFVVEGAKARLREPPVDVISNKLAQGLAAKLCP